MFSPEEISKIIDETSLYEEVLLHDIPDIDLYIDQVNAFIDKKLAHLKRHEKDKLLTKTMINNYTKAGLLMPSNKKKYSRQHIALLILVYYSKQILSINDISILFAPLLQRVKTDDPGQEQYSIVDSIYAMTGEINYQDSNDLKAVCRRKAELILEKTGDINDEERELLDWALLVMFLVSQAAMQKKLAETIIDRFFDNGSDHK